jgi:hypothetical protein
MFSFSKVRVVKCVSRVNPEYDQFKPNQTKNKTYYSLNKPNCKYCKYYIKNESSEQLSKCKKFGQISKNNAFDYDFVEFCREQIDLCGPSGIYFELRESIDFIE